MRLHRISPPVTTVLLVVKEQHPDHKGRAWYLALGREPNPGQHPTAPRTLEPSESGRGAAGGWMCASVKRPAKDNIHLEGGRMRVLEGVVPGRRSLPI